MAPTKKRSLRAKHVTKGEWAQSGVQTIGNNEPHQVLVCQDPESDARKEEVEVQDAAVETWETEVDRMKGANLELNERVGSMQEEVHDYELLNKCLQAKLVRTQEILTLLRKGLYRELCVLKDRVYEKTNTRLMLDADVASLLEGVMSFLQKHVGIPAYCFEEWAGG